jgi:phosphoribosylformylglycinamidine cyclo-ligase
MTYADSGVDISKEEKAIKELISNIKNIRTGFGKPLGGHYAGMIDFGKYALVLCTDGVGSKVKIASELKKWDTIGIDCIAMNVNDAICVGAEPLAFVDYLAIDDPNPKITREIGKGLAKGAEIANISIVGGETASLPEIVKGFDLAGTCLAYVKKDEIILGEKITPGDLIIGLSSSGIHSNGYTLVRKVIDKSDFSLNDRFPGKEYIGKTIGDILLTPTQIYVKEILTLLKNKKIHGIAHITGGGLLNLPRLNTTVKFTIDKPFEPNPIFNFIQEYGEIEDREMYKTFNMGMGMAIIIPDKFVDESIKILKKHTKSEVKIVGKIKKGKGVELTDKGLAF